MPTPRTLFDLWNLHRAGLPKALELTQSRARHAQARLKEHTPEEWTICIQRITDSHFCCGDNDRGWRATFDWLLRPDTYAKVMEGKYDNRPARLTRQTETTLQAAAAIMREQS